MKGLCFVLYIIYVLFGSSISLPPLFFSPCPPECVYVVFDDDVIVIDVVVAVVVAFFLFWGWWCCGVQIQKRPARTADHVNRYALDEQVDTRKLSDASTEQAKHALEELRRQELELEMELEREFNNSISPPHPPPAVIKTLSSKRSGFAPVGTNNGCDRDHRGEVDEISAELIGISALAKSSNQKGSSIERCLENPLLEILDQPKARFLSTVL